jgi:hypothetical protein
MSKELKDSTWNKSFEAKGKSSLQDFHDNKRHKYHDLADFIEGRARDWDARFQKTMEALEKGDEGRKEKIREFEKDLAALRKSMTEDTDTLRNLVAGITKEEIESWLPSKVEERIKEMFANERAKLKGDLNSETTQSIERILEVSSNAFDILSADRRVVLEFIARILIMTTKVEELLTGTILKIIEYKGDLTDFTLKSSESNSYIELVSAFLEPITEMILKGDNSGILDQLASMRNEPFNRIFPENPFKKLLSELRKDKTFDGKKR